MKTTLVFLIACLLLNACSSPKKTTTKAEPPKVSREDLLTGGTSFSNPVVIMVQKERAGLDEEYKWLANNYPGYSVIRRRHVSRAPKQYDIVRIKTKQGQMKDIYFDSTRYWGKN